MFHQGRLDDHVLARALHRHDQRLAHAAFAQELTRLIGRFDGHNRRRVQRTRLVGFHSDGNDAIAGLRARLLSRRAGEHMLDPRFVAEPHPQERFVVGSGPECGQLQQQKRNRPRHDWPPTGEVPPAGGNYTRCALAGCHSRGTWPPSVSQRSRLRAAATPLALRLTVARSAEQPYLPVPAFGPPAAEMGVGGALASGVHVAQKLIITGRAIGAGRGVAGVVPVTGGAKVSPPRRLRNQSISQAARPARAVRLPRAAANNARQQRRND